MSLPSLPSYRAFQYDNVDYYELQEDLGEVLSKGAIFVHDRNDKVRGSIAEGCLILCYTPDGDCYSGSSNCGIGGKTVVFHAEFARSSLFKLVSGPSFERERELDSLRKQIEGLREKLDLIDKKINSQTRYCR